ncbi:MAG: calcium-binding protein [Gemmobacter sp.]|nr:calcium-binding protein [Gemmobacter sp.]
MAITSTKTFTETVDIGDYDSGAKVIETGVAYYGTLLKSPADDYRDVFVFTPDESGYYRMSWEFSLPNVRIGIGSDSDYYGLNRTKVASDWLIGMEAGVKYTIALFDYRTDEPAIGYGFDLHLSGERATSGDDLVKGTAEKNRLHGFEGQDTIVGFAKNDSLYGGEDNDLLSGGGGYDFLDGGSGDDVLVGGTEGDTLSGDDGNDLLYGGGGNDYLYGLVGDDTLMGGLGSDRLHADEGADVLIGNRGADYFRISEASSSVQFYGGAGRDNGYAEIGIGSAISGWLGGGDDNFRGEIRHDGDLTLYGGRGDDAIRFDTYRTLEVVDGKYIFTYADIGDVSFYGGAGNDDLTGSGDFYGGADSDTITGWSRGGGESNRLYGGYGADILRAAGHEDNVGDWLHGGIGNDQLYSAHGRDTLDGGLGKDTIVGSTGRDRILLGADGKAQDVVQYTHVSQSKSNFGLDRISGFTSGVDVLDFYGVDAHAQRAGNQILLYGGDTALANGLWHQLVDGDTHVFLDVDGDALADMQVILKGVTTVAEGDFIL